MNPNYVCERERKLKIPYFKPLLASIFLFQQSDSHVWQLNFINYATNTSPIKKNDLSKVGLTVR
jgi:hypothetical protein